MPGGTFAPQNFPPRDPRAKNQKNGRIKNPVRYMELGGFSGPGKWEPAADTMTLEKPSAGRGKVVKDSQSSMGR